jgi:predicted esterase
MGLSIPMMNRLRPVSWGHFFCEILLIRGFIAASVLVLASRSLSAEIATPTDVAGPAEGAGGTAEGAGGTAEGEWSRMRPITPRGVVAKRTKVPIQVDGVMASSEWDHADWTDEFVDIQGPSHSAPRYSTRAKLLWDEEFLYIAAQLTEPHLQGTLRDHDTVIFQDNDFEVFIDPDGDNHRYAELEMNALNTTWDLFLDRPYKDGGNADNSFEIAGLKTAVQLRGTLNDPSDVDDGWSVEIAIPWPSFQAITHVACPPKNGDDWRFGFSRVEWQFDIVDGKYQKKPGLPEDNWVWSPQGIIDMHRPERWGFVQFRDTTEASSFVGDATLGLRDQLMEVYHRQRVYHGSHQQFADSWDSLRWKPQIESRLSSTPILNTESGYIASIAKPVETPSGTNRTWIVGNVTEDSRLTVRTWNASVLSALDEAGANRDELEKLLRTVPDQQFESAEFLVTNMPLRDLQSLEADFLLAEIKLAHKTLDESPWGKQIPKEIFLNNILPYANINERRDAWRKDFRERFAPLVAGARSPAQAAAMLNQKLFAMVNVKYSTQRAKADQSPYESIQSGLASCTGLSVLLIDACRSQGIPARFVGTPLWSDNSGNHSWIEVWDNGWHFTGAAEPSGDQLDQAWFIGRASTAKRDDPKHAIYAVSFRKTPLRFPLVWDRSIDYIRAVNVTDRYKQLGFKAPEGTQMVSFRVVDPKTRSRVQAMLRVKDAAGKTILEGMTKDERFDSNDHLHQYLKAGEKYTVDIQWGQQQWSDAIDVGDQPRLVSWETPVAAPANQPAVMPEGSDVSATILELTRYLAQAPENRSPLAEQSFANMPLSKEQAIAAERLIVDDYQNHQREARKAEFEAKELVIGDLKMPFAYKVFGEMPAKGRSLYISMHGGGGAPRQVNDSQWENQKRLYQLEEGVYVAPRAPTDTWDLWHQSHIDAFLDRLIENFVLFEGVNPDRVFLMGYSAGGDGVYQVAPRMADRFAAASMMAGHPNETSPLGLRNLPFTIHMGAKDSAYNRNKTAADWKEALEQLQKTDPEGYPHYVKLHKGKGHWMDRQDAEAIPWMHKHSRNRFPKRIVWKQDDVVQPRFYWLSTDPKTVRDRPLVVAQVAGQGILFEQSDIPAIDILLRDDLIHMDEPIQVRFGDRELFKTSVSRTIAIMDETLRQRGDPQGVFWGKLSIDLSESIKSP